MLSADSTPPSFSFFVKWLLYHHKSDYDKDECCYHANSNNEKSRQGVILMWNPPNDDFFDTVWLIVKQIPEGVVSSYGQIATMIPPMPEVTPDDYKRLSPRWVGTAMRNVPSGSGVPWQRVINSQGKISLLGATGAKQRTLLEEEGVEFDASGTVDLAVYGWQGPDDDWLNEHNLLPPDVFAAKPKQKKLF